MGYVTDVAFILITLSVFVIKQNGEKCVNLLILLFRLHILQIKEEPTEQRHESERQEIYGVDKERHIRYR